MSNLKQRQKHRVPDLSKPSVKGLAYLLRHEELWPESFGPWNYNATNSCAIGLAAERWPELSAVCMSIGGKLGIEGYTAHHIFFGLSGAVPQTVVTPENVAERLEALEE